MQGQLQRLAGQHHQEQREARLVVNTGGGGPEDFVGCTNRRVVLEHRDAVEQGSIGRQLAGGADIGEREVAVLTRGFDRGVQGSQGLCDCDARLVSSPDRHDVRGQSDETIDVGKGIGAPRDDRTEDDVPRAAGVAAEQAGPGELDHRVEGDAFVSEGSSPHHPRQVGVQLTSGNAELNHRRVRGEGSAGEAHRNVGRSRESPPASSRQNRSARSRSWRCSQPI